MNFIRKIHRIIKSVLTGTLIVVCICGCGKNTSEFIEISDDTNMMHESEATQSQENPVVSEMTEESYVYIYICGAVKSPGVYTLPIGSRICDAMDAAGGMTEDAATDYWNQAKVLVDGEMIYVPTIEEAKDRTFLEQEKDDGKVNINTATEEELMTLPGIGQSKARAILNYRNKIGRFSSLEEIKQVEGIKDGLYEKIKEYIVIN